MNEAKLIELVEKVESRTRDGQIKWEKTAEEDVFQSILGSMILRIERELLENADTVPVLTLITKDGIRLERMTPRTLKGAGVRDYYSLYESLDATFKNAKRQALGVEKAIDDILSELKEPPF